MKIILLSTSARKNNLFHQTVVHSTDSINPEHKLTTLKRTKQSACDTFCLYMALLDFAWHPGCSYTWVLQTKGWVLFSYYLTLQTPPRLSLLSQVPAVGGTSASSFSCTIYPSESSCFCRKKKYHFNLGTAIPLTQSIFYDQMTWYQAQWNQWVLLSASNHALRGQQFLWRKLWLFKLHTHDYFC